MSSEPRYDTRSGRQVCLDCGAHVEEPEAHTRFHAILNDTARAVAVLTVAHLGPSVHDLYEAYDTIQKNRNQNNWSAEAFAQVVADLPDATP